MDCFGEMDCFAALAMTENKPTIGGPQGRRFVFAITQA
jgi:hypothetical protein